MFPIKRILFLTLFSGLFLTASAQSNSPKPFSGSKHLRKFSIGVNAGVLNPSTIIGGSNDFTNLQNTLGYGANMRYQLNHYLGLQADYLGGTLEANQKGYSGTPRPVYSFKTKFDYAASLNAVFTFSNLNFLHAKNTIVPYVSAGGGMISYKPTFINEGSTTEIEYNNGKSVKELFIPVGAGLKISLSKVINLDLGYRMNFVDRDNLDGTRYQDLHKDKFSYGYGGLEFTFGKKRKPRMLFDNPVARLNNNLQSMIDTVKQDHKKLTADSDGDGVPDLYDKEPNTPKGCPVDAQGVMRDTDGDGVPDCRDKEMITPTQCQPVDADGVGTCPEPGCCKDIRDSLMSSSSTTNGCNMNLPSISFKGTKVVLSRDARAMLATVAAQLKNSPSCSILVTGYPVATKASQSVCDKRVKLIKSYLIESEGISADRINVNCEVGGGDANTVDIQAR